MSAEVIEKPKAERVKRRKGIDEIAKKLFKSRKKRIPVSEVYFKKGMYRELVPDPFNLAR